MIFAHRSGLAPSSTERNAIHLAFIASFVLLMLSFHTGPSSDPLILSLGLPGKFTLPARGALALFFAGATGGALLSMARRSSIRAILAPLTLAITQFFWFLLPALIELFSGHEVPQTRYSSGILAVLHSAQYLWITSYYQKREARAGVGRWRTSRYFLTLVAGGIALFIPGPWLVSRLFHADFATSFLAFTALVNLHHFILDGALWKLRDSRVAAFLLQTNGKAEANEGATKRRWESIVTWLAGPAPAARTIRIATVALLFAWAAMDQLHFYWSSQADRFALQRAARLNPDDSSVQMRLARAETLAGNRQGSLEALQRAVSINPANLAQQEAYARGLIEAGRTMEAYGQYQKMLQRWPRNTNALVNYGLLAQRLGHKDEALNSWQRAIEIDPGQAQPQIYLAQALDQLGEAQAAARHYRVYLQIVAAHQEDHRGEGATVIASLIKVADADAAANHSSEALTGYEAATRFAETTKDKALETLALVHRADLEEKLGNAAAAALEYRQALQMDASLSDPLSAGTDWFNYGQFLRRQHQPERLVFVCFLRAEELTHAVQGDARTVISDARSESEVRMGRETAAVKRSSAAILREALALPPAAFSQRAQ